MLPHRIFFCEAVVKSQSSITPIVSSPPHVKGCFRRTRKKNHTNIVPITIHTLLFRLKSPPNHPQNPKILASPPKLPKMSPNFLLCLFSSHLRFSVFFLSRFFFSTPPFFLFFRLLLFPGFPFFFSWDFSCFSCFSSFPSFSSLCGPSSFSCLFDHPHAALLSSCFFLSSFSLLTASEAFFPLFPLFHILPIPSLPLFQDFTAEQEYLT